MLSKGCSYNEISTELKISKNTVVSHVNQIYPKLGITKSSQIQNLMLDNFTV